MNVRELRTIMATLPDDAPVLVWVDFGDDDKQAIDVTSAHVSGVTDEQQHALHINTFD